MAEWNYRLRAKLNDDLTVQKMTVEELDEDVAKDWAEWDAEHPYEPHPRNAAGGTGHDAQGKPADISGSGSGWKPSMTSEEADRWAAGSSIPEPMYHATDDAAAKAIADGGFDLSHSGDRAIEGGFKLNPISGGVNLTGDQKTASNFGDQVLETRVNVHNVADEKETARLMAIPFEQGVPQGTVEYMHAAMDAAKSAGYDALKSGSRIVVLDPQNVTVVTK